MLQEDYNLFDLDKHKLDEEWLQQPKLRRQAGEREADLRAEYERAKRRRDVTEAELSLACRRDPEKFGLDKATDKSVEAAVVAHPRMEVVEREVITSKHDLDIQVALVHALDDRKKALEKLVDLFLANYWAEPRTKTTEASRAFGPRGGDPRD